MKFTLTAVIPTAQYSNIQPSIEVEAETYEEAERMVLPYIESLSARYAEEGKSLIPRGKEIQAVKLISELDGGYAFFDESTHTYTNSDGKKFISGSEFAEKFAYEFPLEAMAEKAGKARGIAKERLKDMWSLKGLASSSFGTALHAALEMWGKYGAESGEKALHDQPILKNAVESFYAGREDENAMYEVFVVDMAGLKCGRIDRLLVIDKDKKICRVQDYKTNADLTKMGSPKKLKAPYSHVDNNKLGIYQLQLSFYAYILSKLGWTVEGLDIFNYTDKWETISLEVLNLN